MDEINPNDSSSGQGVFYQHNDTKDSNLSTLVINTAKRSRSTRSEIQDQSKLIFVKDDKYKSNVDYLEELMGVLHLLL